MKVNLKHLPGDGTPKQVQATVDLTSLRRWGENPIRRPVEVKASFANQNGIVTMAYTAKYMLDSVCARCLEPVERAGKLQMEHILMEKVEDERNDRFILVPDAVLDLEELVMADISLELDGVPVCSENCKGLCPICGVNRNTRSCDCPAGEPTERRPTLGDLLEH